LRATPVYRAGRQLENRVRPQTDGHAARSYIARDFPDLQVLVQENDIQPHFHTKGMDRFAGHDPKSGARFQILGVEQAATARFACTSHADVCG
jgi:hypothetical protein